jgi:hypothetical protein
MGDHEQQVAKKYARMDFDELADAPLEALGLSNNDVDALKQALGIRTVRELAEHRLVRRAGNREPHGSKTAAHSKTVAFVDGHWLPGLPQRVRLAPLLPPASTTRG